LAKGAPVETGVKARVTAIIPPRLAVLTAFVVVYILAMPLLGFMASSAVFLFAALWLLWRRGPLRSALLTAVSLVAVWLVFREIFQVLLPRGSVRVDFGLF
jgi:hypothetical protein